jgi:hypothetical protein
VRTGIACVASHPIKAAAQTLQPFQLFAGAALPDRLDVDVVTSEEDASCWRFKHREFKHLRIVQNVLYVTSVVMGYTGACQCALVVSLSAKPLNTACQAPHCASHLPLHSCGSCVTVHAQGMNWMNCSFSTDDQAWLAVPACQCFDNFSFFRTVVRTLGLSNSCRCVSA